MLSDAQVTELAYALEDAPTELVSPGDYTRWIDWLARTIRAVTKTVAIKRFHPMQPLELDREGTLRFRANAIVKYLLEAGLFDMNDLALIPFSLENREQFIQLIGYPLDGYGELSYISDEAYERAKQTAPPLEDTGC